jgi:hypothetical protein
MNLQLPKSKIEKAGLIVFIGITGSISWGIWSSVAQNKLEDAARKNNIEEAKIALRMGANPNLQDSEFGESPFFWAIENSSLEVAELLLKNGANTRLKNGEGQDTIHMAQSSKRMQELLMRYDPNIR